MRWHICSYLEDGVSSRAGLPQSRGVLSALLSGEPTAALLAFIHSIVPWEDLALSASPSVLSTARSAVSRMLAASVSPTVPFLTVMQLAWVSCELCAGHSLPSVCLWSRCSQIRHAIHRARSYDAWA